MKNKIIQIGKFPISMRKYSGPNPTFFLDSTKKRFIEKFMIANENVYVDINLDILYDTLDILNTLLSTHFDRHGGGLTYLCST